MPEKSETTEYLEIFLRNLLLDEKHELHNRSMHISGVFETKVDIESTKVDIENVKVDIRDKMLSYSSTLSEKTINHVIDLYVACKEKEYFGRSVVEEVTGLKSSGASKLISLLLNSNVIEPVSGKGKGKYKFFSEV